MLPAAGYSRERLAGAVAATMLETSEFARRKHVRDFRCPGARPYWQLLRSPSGDPTGGYDCVLLRRTKECVKFAASLKEDS